MQGLQFLDFPFPLAFFCTILPPVMSRSEGGNPFFFSLPLFLFLLPIGCFPLSTFFCLILKDLSLGSLFLPATASFRFMPLGAWSDKTPLSFRFQKLVQTKSVEPAFSEF